MNGAPIEPRLAGIMLDFDGLVLDTETTRLQAWTHGWASAGMVLDANEYTRVHHTPPGCSAHQLAQHLTTGEHHRAALDLLLAEVSADSLRRANCLPLLPGVRELLTAARHAGISTALVSGSGRPWVAHHLTRLHLERAFDVVITADDVPNGKRDPAPYLLALAQLALPARHVIALEDSPVGLASATGARIACAVVPNRVTAGLAFDHACTRYRSLEEVTVAMLREAARQFHTPAVR